MRVRCEEGQTNKAETHSSEALRTQDRHGKHTRRENARAVGGSEEAHTDGKGKQLGRVRNTLGRKDPARRLEGHTESPPGARCPTGAVRRAAGPGDRAGSRQDTETRTGWAGGSAPLWQHRPWKQVTE